MKRILIIEDTQDLAFGLRSNLGMEGYDVRVADTGPEGLRQAQVFEPDLIVLDLMLPQMDGFEVLESMRDGGLTMPVLILSARGEEIDKVRGLRLGADDYVTKPLTSPSSSSTSRSARAPAAFEKTANPWNSRRRSSTCCWSSFATRARSSPASTS